MTNPYGKRIGVRDELGADAREDRFEQRPLRAAHRVAECAVDSRAERHVLAIYRRIEIDPRDSRVMDAGAVPGVRSPLIPCSPSRVAEAFRIRSGARVAVRGHASRDSAWPRARLPGLQQRSVSSAVRR